MDQQQIRPIENFIINGIVDRLHRVFGCYTQYTNSENIVTEMTKIRKEKGVRFPYLFVSLSNVEFIQDYYNSNYMTRRGMVVKLADTGNALAKVKMMPAAFSFSLSYYTDRNDSTNGGCLWFLKRWMFARRLGYLKFNVKYGNTYSCPVIMDESLSHPKKQPETDGMSCYTIEGNVIVHGYVSEAQLLTDGVLQDMDMTIHVNGHSTPEKLTSYWGAPK